MLSRQRLRDNSAGVAEPPAHGQSAKCSVCLGLSDNPPSCHGIRKSLQGLLQGLGMFRALQVMVHLFGWGPALHVVVHGVGRGPALHVVVHGVGWVPALHVVVHGVGWGEA